MHQRTLISASRGLISRRASAASFNCTSCPTFFGFAVRRSLATLPNLPLFRALKNHDPARLAVVHNPSFRSFTYGNLVADVVKAQDQLWNSSGRGRDGLRGERIAFLAENSYDYVVILLSILASDAIAVPLSTGFPIHELKYIMNNSQAGMLVATERYADMAEKIMEGELDRQPILDMRGKIRTGSSDVGAVELEGLDGNSGGMMLYTSGTTNRPVRLLADLADGVVIPQSALASQAASLLEAWKYSPGDRLLHLLPLHHIHGTVNAIITPVLSGSSIEFMFPFNPTAVWNRLAEPFLPEGTKDKITFLNAVPTIYNRLLSTFPTLSPQVQSASKVAISPEHLRLNISGSAALPTPTKKAWQDLSNGNVLLERYGMTEVGMALSCGLDFTDRVDGSVGWPLPSVEVRLVDTDTNKVIQPGEEIDGSGRAREGEIQLRGPTIFREYWGNEKATQETFAPDADGKGPWFKTGDVATRRSVETAGLGKSGEWAKGPMYFIQGRRSVDIIKVGGEKVSALEVERELLSLYVHQVLPSSLQELIEVTRPQIAEAAVVGLPSEQWGQKVVAIVVLNSEVAARTGRNGKSWGVLDMRWALKDRLAAYKLPSEMKVLEGAIPRNAMGKGTVLLLTSFTSLVPC
ncbi:protein sgdD [Aspergillus nidulans FGSC A4]|uniref:AMP-binding enzyme, putative (AFU_orthologue AFUA_7G01530) n=1 Tax=Emericella nidulans (strain FGSC A4 / ATCC 38163 / CBS 112.46 / NRRL 194 / M139) TaxID=227321 RepID=C8VHK4_EMENI|nr:protein sgdD [Aspergillus nidulans FGSC A4]CBF82751.1 TPA: AMP-binding enzyme, putative (AFU_orthologue; AFUA_7G01530) [Aspergillus nidulans FGSC A4]